MRVSVNATCISARPSGARARFQLLYSHIFTSRPDISFTVYQPSDLDLSSLFPPLQNVRFVFTPLPSRNPLLRNLLGLIYWPIATLIRPSDVFDQLYLPLPPVFSRSIYLLIHDLRFLNSPNPLVRLLYGIAARFSISISDRVIAVSNTLSREIKLHYKSANVSVVYNPSTINKSESSSESSHSTLERFHLQRPFILSVGHLEPRKNFHRLIAAYKSLVGIPDLPTLIIAGQDSGDYSRLQALTNDLHLQNSVRFLTDVNDAELRALFQCCSLFVFPSLYEGFGLPILEAFASGCPIVLSNLPVFREITNNRLTYFDPLSVDDIAQAICTSLFSENFSVPLDFYASRLDSFSAPNLANTLVSLYTSHTDHPPIGSSHPDL